MQSISSSVGNKLNEMLGFFGGQGAQVSDAVTSLQNNRVQFLENLADDFLDAAVGKGQASADQRLQKMLSKLQELAAFLTVSSPMSMYPAMRPFTGGGYAGVDGIDISPGSTNLPFFKMLASKRRRAAAFFERLLRSNPHARMAFEAQVGGQIVSYGTENKGRMLVQRYSPGATPSAYAMHSTGMMNPYAGTALGYFAGMEAAILNQAAQLGNMGSNTYGNPFIGMTLGGFANVLGMQGPAGAGAGAYDNSGPLGGRGWGSWNPLAAPGRVQNTNPTYEAAHQAEVAGVLADPSLTVEDKVTLLIMLIMKKMDKDIERQAQYVNSIQQQQSARTSGKGGKIGGAASGLAGGPFGGATGNVGGNSPSIDVETLKLKRMVDKRSQMFDMLRQIIDKYNQTAKGIIDSIGR